MQDTSDYLRKINTIEKLADYLYLVSLDVRSFYTSILNCEGIKAIKTSLENFQKKKKTVATKVITTFLSLIFTLSNFVFNWKKYLQIQGCAMGKFTSWHVLTSPWVILDGLSLSS